VSGLEERIANTDSGAITSIQAVYGRQTTSRPSGGAYLLRTSRIARSSRAAGQRGLYPAIDLLQSNSKMVTPTIIGERHYLLAQEIRKTLAHYAN